VSVWGLRLAWHIHARNKGNAEDSRYLAWRKQWGIWLVSLSVPSGWLGIIGSITITFLILKVSGIPMLERKIAQNPAFESYKKRVSMFFPIPNYKKI